MVIKTIDVVEGYRFTLFAVMILEHWDVRSFDSQTMLTTVNQISVNVLDTL